MTTKHFIVGTAGHIDHGKSSLVKALTGTDPDRLPEEKARGMTIDLGFAHLKIPDPDNKDATYSIGMIDVPGHADFVKNMVAGVGSIDAALLIVAADDGWMPQTEEHLQILTYLGVQHAVIALTKADLAEDRDFAVEMLRESLKGTLYESAPVIPTAAPAGIGLTELKTALAKLLGRIPEPRDIGKPRLPVDRMFSPTGIGTVVTGTLTGGILEKGQDVVIQPSGRKSRIRAIQTHNRDAESSVPGTRTALNLPDAPIATKEKKDGLNRGDVVTLESLGSSCTTLDVLLEKSARNADAQTLAGRPLRNGQKVYWHHGGASFPAKVYFLDGKTMEAGRKVLAELRFSQPAFAFCGDRFVLRDWSKQATLAGGVILDPDAQRPQFRKARQRAFLESRAADHESAEALILSLVTRDNAALRSGLLVKSRFSQAEVAAAADSLIRKKQVVADGNWLIDGRWWQKRLDDAGSVIKAFHRASPQLQGMDLTEFANQTAGALPDKKLLDLMVASLCSAGYVRTGKVIRWGAHRPSLPAQLQQAGAKIRAALAKNLLEPPNAGELAPSPVDKQALKFLLDTGEAVQLDEKAVLSIEGFEKLKGAIVDHLQKSGKATASDLRQVTGTTRRILIPFLERMDRDGVTRRNGDFRTLKA